MNFTSMIFTMIALVETMIGYWILGRKRRKLVSSKEQVNTSEYLSLREERGIDVPESNNGREEIENVSSQNPRTKRHWTKNCWLIPVIWVLFYD